MTRYRIVTEDMRGADGSEAVNALCDEVDRLRAVLRVAMLHIEELARDLKEGEY